MVKVTNNVYTISTLILLLRYNLLILVRTGVSFMSTFSTIETHCCIWTIAGEVTRL